MTSSEGPTVVVNGETRALGDRPVEALLRSVGHDPASPGIAVAVNDSIVPRSEWRSRALRNGDRVEIVGAVQGG